MAELRTMNNLMLMQQNRCIMDSRVVVPEKEIECSDGHIQVHALQGILHTVELLPQGSWDQLNKTQHQATSKMVSHYAKDCPNGLRVEDTENPKFKKVTMIEFLELFELEQTEFSGVRHVKVVGRFARREKRKSGVHFKLRFQFVDGHSITVSFHAVRASMLRGQQAQERRALRQAFNTYMDLNPSDIELELMRMQLQVAIQRINQQREENVDEDTGKRQREDAPPQDNKRPRVASTDLVPSTQADAQPTYLSM